MGKTLEELFADAIVDHDPIADLPVTGPMIRRELDLIDRRLRTIAAHRRKPKAMLLERDALEARKLRLLLRVPR